MQAIFPTIFWIKSNCLIFKPDNVLKNGQDNQILLVTQTVVRMFQNIIILLWIKYSFLCSVRSLREWNKLHKSLYEDLNSLNVDRYVLGDSIYQSIHGRGAIGRHGALLELSVPRQISFMWNKQMGRMYLNVFHTFRENIKIIVWTKWNLNID